VAGSAWGVATGRRRLSGIIMSENLVSALVDDRWGHMGAGLFCP